MRGWVGRGGPSQQGASRRQGHSSLKQATPLPGGLLEGEWAAHARHAAQASQLAPLPARPPYRHHAPSSSGATSSCCSCETARSNSQIPRRDATRPHSNSSSSGEPATPLPPAAPAAAAAAAAAAPRGPGSHPSAAAMMVGSALDCRHRLSHATPAAPATTRPTPRWRRGKMTVASSPDTAPAPRKTDRDALRGRGQEAGAGGGAFFTRQRWFIGQAVCINDLGGGAPPSTTNGLRPERWGPAAV
jgi:hypothetical protein